MKKALCVLMSLGLLLVIASAVTAQSTGCTDASGASIPCPDRDGDGVQDSADRCISDPGPATNNGCPETTQTGGSAGGDADNDGVGDSSDLCATIAGTAEFSGCPGPTATPIPDSDADGEHDGIDQCPTQPGPASSQGCPATAAGASTGPTPTLPPTTNQPNPLNPPADGPCVLTTASSTAANVRAEPSLSAAVVSSIDPNQFYPVLSAVVNAEGTWYRIDAGWVSDVIAKIGGKCPARIIAMGPSGFSIPQGEWDDAKGGIFPEEECFELFNGMLFCHTILSATADDGSNEGSIPWDVVTCGFGPGGVICVATTLTYFTEDECPPEFCEPSPPPSDGGNGGNGGEGDDGGGQGEDEGAVSCESLLNDLAVPTEEGNTPYLTTYFPDGGVGFGRQVPPMEPQPCLLNVFLVREGAAANGLIPVDRLVLEIDWPSPTAAYDAFLRLDGIPGESKNTEPGREPSATLFGLVRQDLRGNVCITTSHGNFIYCPGEPQPPAMPDLGRAPISVPDDVILDLLANPLPDGDTEYECEVGKDWIGCGCDVGPDCDAMLANACFGLEVICEGNRCACVFENTDD